MRALGEERHDQVVLVIAGEGGEQVGLRDPGLVEHGGLAAVTADHPQPRGALTHVVGAVGADLDHRDVVLVEELLGEVHA